MRLRMLCRMTHASMCRTKFRSVALPETDPLRFSMLLATVGLSMSLLSHRIDRSDKLPLDKIGETLAREKWPNKKSHSLFIMRSAGFHQPPHLPFVKSVNSQSTFRTKNDHPNHTNLN
jgi:hypothetical protein